MAEEYSVFTYIEKEIPIGEGPKPVYRIKAVVMKGMYTYQSFGQSSRLTIAEDIAVKRALKLAGIDSL